MFKFFRRLEMALDMEIGNAGKLFRFLFWSTLVAFPINTVAYCWLWSVGVFPAMTSIWYIAGNLAGFWSMWLLGKGRKCGWWLLVTITCISSAVTITAEPDLWWSGFITLGTIGLYYLALRARGYYQRLT